MSTEQRTIEVQQYIDHNELFVMTLLPCGFPGKFIEVVEDPVFGPTCRLVSREEFEEGIEQYYERKQKANQKGF